MPCGPAWTDQRPAWMDDKSEVKPGAMWLVWPPPAPEHEWALLVGDTAGNLRRALNQIAWQLAVKNVGPSREPDNRTQFPIWSDQGDFEKNGKRQWRDILPAALGEIKAVQPYNRSTWPNTHLLSVVRELSDKANHRFLVKPVAETGFTVPGGQTALMGFDNPVEVTIIGVGSGKPHNSVKPNATLERSIDIPTLSPPQYDITVLDRIHQFICDEIFPRFNRFFP